MEKETIVLGDINITPLLKAQKAFQKAVAQAETELEQDGAIQRFEFTFELTWKTLKRILSFKGISVNSPRDVFRESAKQGFIEDVSIWFKFIKKRNLSSHTYDQEQANEIFSCLPKFEEELCKVIEKNKKIMKKIDVSEKELSIIKYILKDYSNVYVFGSRIKGTSKKLSDLDICLKDDISDYEYELLKEKFENSDLPFNVDIVEYNKISNSFKKVIDKDCVKLI